MAKTATANAPRANYGAIEALLILVALALVAFTAWYVHHATVSTNTTYSIHETSQKPATPKPKPVSQQ